MCQISLNSTLFPAAPAQWGKAHLTCSPLLSYTKNIYKNAFLPFQKSRSNASCNCLPPTLLSPLQSMLPQSGVFLWLWCESWCLNLAFHCFFRESQESPGRKLILFFLGYLGQECQEGLPWHSPKITSTSLLHSFMEIKLRWMEWKCWNPGIKSFWR